MTKDGKCLCLMCGRRLSGLFSSGHALGCPVGATKKPQAIATDLNVHRGDSS